MDTAVVGGFECHYRGKLIGHLVVGDDGWLSYAQAQDAVSAQGPEVDKINLPDYNNLLKNGDF